MNYGRRTTKTTTHRDTPLSATPEPRFAMFQNLDEITVTPSKEQIENYTSKTDEETDAIKGDTRGMNKAVAIPNFSRIKGVDLEPSMDTERKARGYGAGYMYYRNRINEGTTSKSISEANAKRDAAKKENAAALLKFKSSKKKRGE